VDECKPLPGSVSSCSTNSPSAVILALTRGLHSFTFQLNVSAFCGNGGASRGCLGAVLGVLGGIVECA